MLLETLKKAQIEAMSAGAKEKLSTVRLILAAIKNREIALRSEGKRPIADDDIVELLHKMIKQSRESIRLYEEGGRLDLAEKEGNEIKIIESFLPPQLGEDEIRKLCIEAVADLKAVGLKDMGRVMKHLKESHAGSMDFAKASAIIRDLLTA